MFLADPDVAIQTAWMMAADTVYCADLPGAMFNWIEMVPEVQSGMLAPPFMDHRMTSINWT